MHLCFTGGDREGPGEERLCGGSKPGSGEVESNLRNFPFHFGVSPEPAWAWLVKQDLKSMTQEVVTEGPWT